MIDWLRYTVASIRYPHLKDFLSMGLGIKARYHRCKPFWEKHLEFSRSFIASSLKASQPKSVLVVGCGRLLDCPIETLQELSPSVTCIDIDPFALSYAKRKVPSWRYISGDVTGVFREWTVRLKRALHDEWGDFELFLKELRAFRPMPGALANLGGDSFDVVISLNILGQLPVYWRDRVDAAVAKHATSLDVESQRALEEVIWNHCALLQTSHLEQIFSVARKQVILITDDLFHYYQQNRSEWDSTSALYVSLPERGALWEQAKRDSWLWHIAPQGIEEKEYGVIHQMRAARYDRALP